MNDVKTLNLDAFVSESNNIPDNTYFRLSVVTSDNIPYVTTMKKNEHYFPTMEFVKDAEENNGWRKRMNEGGSECNGVQNLSAEGFDDDAEGELS